jgi:hypothetical protein
MKASRQGREVRKEGQELCAQTGTSLVSQPIHDSLDSVLEMDFAKVNQQSEFVAGEPQLSENIQSAFAPLAPLA